MSQATRAPRAARHDTSDPDATRLYNRFIASGEQDKEHLVNTEQSVYSLIIPQAEGRAGREPPI
jgi:hypothetical protein